MGAADIVPGVSGGTIALVLGIYERLLKFVSDCAKVLESGLKFDIAEFKKRIAGLDFAFGIPLALGVVTAVVSLAALIEGYMETQPERLAGFFFGLVVGSIYLAWRMFKQTEVSIAAKAGVAGVVGVVAFGVLGFQPAPAEDPALWIYLISGMISICAMILPGISGSFVLLMLGMYAAVLGAIHDRDLAVIAVFGLGAIIGLAVFSRILKKLLDAHHDLVLAAMVGLMIGSFRVLWPFPYGVGVISDVAGESISGTGLETPSEDWPIVLGLGVVGLVLVLSVSFIAGRTK